LSRILPVFLLVLLTASLFLTPSSGTADHASKSAEERHRSPIALALSTDGTRLLTANQTANSVSLVDLKAGTVLDEVETGEKPVAVAFAPDGRWAVVAHWYDYDIAILKVGLDRLEVVGRVEVGPEPRGVVVSRDGRNAYVTVGVANEVARIDLDSQTVTGRLAVGREPRGIAVSPDGRRLMIGNNRSQSISVIDTTSWTVERTISIAGDNLRQVAIAADGMTGYVANMKNRGFATTKNNIDIGWVLGQRLTRVMLDGSDSEYATLTLDPRGEAMGDAHGVAVSGDNRYLAISCGGTHELVLFRTDLNKLPWRPGGSRDLIAADLLNGDGRFRRVPLGGRPTELTFAADSSTLYVANYLADAVQVVDAEAGALVRTIHLGGPREASLARRGEILFHDATRSFNQWYSCNTCHSEGHTNGLTFDTMNDGWHDFSTAHTRSRKKVPTLRGVAQTGPWTWHGWQTSLDEAMIESFTKSMQGSHPSDEDVRAIVTYLETLDYPPNPFRGPNGEISEAARRGEAIFKSHKAACSTCHRGPELTDGKIHDVGLGEPGDVYRGHNPPSLRGLYDKDPYLHDGRAATLREVLMKDHNPENLGGEALSEQELTDLIAYLQTL
jgi:YVTN family beta-propeller protein